MRILIFAILLLSSALCQQTYDCNPGCISCNSYYGCDACYNSVLRRKPTLSAVLSNESDMWDCYPKEKPDSCSIYRLGRDDSPYCNECDEGYAYDQNTHTCVLSTIKDCKQAVILNGMIQITCESCNSGTPEKYIGEPCVPFKSPAKGTSYDCLWGGRKGRNEGYSEMCRRCKDGFSTSKDGHCISNPEYLTGCMRITNGECLVCNYYEGYFARFMHSDKCTKTN